MVWSVVLVAMLVSLLASALLMRPAIRLAHRHHFLDRPGKHKRHRREVPNIGGAVLFLSLWGSLGICLLAFPDFLTELRSSILYVFCGASIIFLVGFSDDLTPLSPWTKLLAQVAAGLVLFVGGLAIGVASNEVERHGIDDSKC